MPECESTFDYDNIRAAFHGSFTANTPNQQV
jgi:hypothetical protein